MLGRALCACNPRTLGTEAEYCDSLVYVTRGGGILKTKRRRKKGKEKEKKGKEEEEEPKQGSNFT